jgi:TolB-like protein
MLQALLALALALSAPPTSAATCIQFPCMRARDTVDLRPGVAVFPFTSGGAFGGRPEDLAPMEVGVQQMLLTELAQNSSLRIVERSALRQVLEEQNLAPAGRVDAATAARVGRLIGARYMVFGTLMDLYGDFRMDARVVDVETGEVLRTEQVHGKRRNMYRLLVDLAGRITRGVKLPPLARPVAAERRNRDIPEEATRMYARALMYQDGGRSQEAVELYRQIVQRFPQMTEAREALHQIEEH